MLIESNHDSHPTVRDEDISQLKWFVLQHLPVLLQESMGTKSDSQLVNSVYLDNATLELYKCVLFFRSSPATLIIH